VRVEAVARCITRFPHPLRDAGERAFRHDIASQGLTRIGTRLGTDGDGGKRTRLAHRGFDPHRNYSAGAVLSHALPPKRAARTPGFGWGVCSLHRVSQTAPPRASEIAVSLLLIIIVLLVLFGGGGYYGHRSGWYGRGGGGGGGGLGIILLIVIVIVLLGGFGGTYMGGFWR
jgi:hypothetical protein